MNTALNLETIMKSVRKEKERCRVQFEISQRRRKTFIRSTLSYSRSNWCSQDESWSVQRKKPTQTLGQQAHKKGTVGGVLVLNKILHTRIMTAYPDVL